MQVAWLGQSNNDRHEHSGDQADRQCDSIVGMKSDLGQDVTQGNAKKSPGGNAKSPSDDNSRTYATLYQAQLEKNDAQWRQCCEEDVCDHGAAA